MAIYYDPDGNLRNYEEWSRIVKCPECGKEYEQQCEAQVEGFRDKSYDICPYCKYVRGSSMTVEYTNSKIGKG